MSNLVVSHNGTLVLMQFMVDGLNVVEGTVKLFQNNHTPARSDDESNYTECDFPGYSSQTYGTWDPASNDGDDAFSTVGSAHTFVCSGGGSPQNVYGYYVLAPDGSFMYAQRYGSAPFVMVNAGDTFSVILKLTTRSQFP